MLKDGMWGQGSPTAPRRLAPILGAVARYPLVTPTTASLALSVLMGWRRSFREDALRMVARLRPGLRVEGRLPDLSSAGWLLLANHYRRGEFKSWWISCAVSSLIPREVHWIMTSEFTFPDGWRASTLTPLSAWALPRLAACYGFTSMPPMPPRRQDVEARAHAVRQVLKYISRTRDPLVGLTPEGGDSPDGGLQPLWPGAGRFLQLLAHSGLRFLPIGVYESGEQLCVNIGEPFVPPLASRRSAEGQDSETEQVVMHHLAACLPVDLRGSFA